MNDFREDPNGVCLTAALLLFALAALLLITGVVEDSNTILISSGVSTYAGILLLVA